MHYSQYFVNVPYYNDITAENIVPSSGGREGDVFKISFLEI